MNSEMMPGRTTAIIPAVVHREIRSAMAEDSVVIETGVHAPDASVIWLHGLGADGHDFEPIVPELKLDPGLNIRFIFPHAPMMPVTINQGFVMRAWFDIRTADIGAEPDEKGIRASAEILSELVDAEIGAGIASERIVVAGFSQGGAIALHAGLSYYRRLAGIVALSTFLPLAETLADDKTVANANIPIFLAHGSADPVVPVDLGRRSKKALEDAGYDVEWHEYKNMPHSVSQQEIVDLAEWFEKVLS